MDSRLTDADLIELVQNKLPEELSHAEIRQLHARLRDSNELKAVLLEQLQLETYLNTALSEINLSVDEIVRRAGLLEQQKPNSRWPLWTGLAGLLLLVGLGIYFFSRPGPQPNELAGGPNQDQDFEKGKSENSEKTNGRKTANNDARLPKGDDPKNPIKPDNPQGTDSQKPPVNVAKKNESSRGQPSDPWYDALDPDAAPQLLVNTAYRFPGFQRGDFLLGKEASQWLAAAPGKSFRLQEKESSNDYWVELDGVGQLKAPWVPDAVLRLGVFDDENFRLHFWCGNVGVTLWHYRLRHPWIWTAYRSERKANQPVPERFTQLLTTDDGRQDRVRSGLIEFRYQDGSLVVSQGEVRLLSVPLPSPPQQVIFEGKCKLSELSMYRGEAFPPENPNPRPQVLASVHPGDLTWMTSLPNRDMREGIRELGQTRESNDRWQETLIEGSTFLAQKSGSVSLEVEKSETNVSVSTQLKRASFYEVILRVAEADPGTYITFGDNKGQEIYHVAFMHDRTSKQTVFETTRPSDSHVEVDRNSQRSTVGYFAPGQWIRVVCGFGTFKVWTSGDGLHWGTAHSPAVSVSTPLTNLGLLIKKTETPRKITLERLEVRELSAITSLASQEAREHAPAFGNLSEMDFGTWNHKVISNWPCSPNEPPSFAMDDWRRACVIRSLAESPWTSLSSTLLRGLLEEGIQLPRPIAERFRLLDEVSLLYNLRDSGSASAMAAMYERLGLIATREDHPDPFGLTLARLQTAPIWSDSKILAINARFTREMLLHHAYSQEWNSLDSVARRTEFLMLDSNPRRFYWWERDERNLLEWADTIAHRHAPDKTESRSNWVHRFSRSKQWKHPLVTQLSKEGYNVMAEFEAALTSEAYEDACRIITSAGRAGMAGLLPDSKDPELLVSLPRAIAIAMREHPDLQQSMRDQFGDVGQVRVREAMTRADVEAVEAATVRFYGTEAAAEAYRWLGNRALASGKFAQAAQAYQEALPFAENALARDVQNRLRLAASLLGHEVPSEENSSVEIATTSWTGPEFQRMIEELRKTHARTETSILGDWNTTHLAQPVPPKPARIQVVPRNQFAGDLGNGKYENRSTDWAARQLAVTTNAELMFVSNRFQVVCYQISDGKTRWSRGLGREQGSVNQWAFLPMRPLVVGDRVFVRRLTKRGPELACLNKDKGDLLWHVRPEHHVASDPVFVQNRLLAFVVTIPQSGMLQIELTSFHPETGDVLSQQPVLLLRDEWGGHPPCQILATNGKILCTIGGATLCCDPLGQPQWLQQHPWLATDVDRYSQLQHHHPPIVMDGRVYATQSGVKEVGCYELATGREIWSQPVTEILRIVGIAGDCLIVQTEMGLVGFDRTTGKQRWRHPVSDLLDGIVCGGGRLMYSRLLDYPPEQNVCLVSLDANTGKELSLAILSSLKGKDVRFGPLVQEGDRLWAFTARGFKEARRELVELVPDLKTSPPGPMTPNPLTTWVDRVLPRTFANTSLVLPDWVITSTQNFSANENGAPIVPEFRGEKDVLKTRMGNNRPVHFVREVPLPVDGPQTFKLRLGHEAGKSWTVRVQLGHQTLVEKILDDQTAPNGWLDQEVDLKPWAGKTVWLSVSQLPTADKEPSSAYWKTLKILP